MLVWAKIQSVTDSGELPSLISHDLDASLQYEGESKWRNTPEAQKERPSPSPSCVGSHQHTHHIVSCHLGLLQHIRSQADQVLSVLHPHPGLLRQVLRVLHRALDVPQPVQLTH